MTLNQTLWTAATVSVALFAGSALGKSRKAKAVQTVAMTSTNERAYDGGTLGQVTGRLGQSTIGSTQGMLTIGAQYESSPDGLGFYAGIDRISHSENNTDFTDMILRGGAKIVFDVPGIKPYGYAGYATHSLSSTYNSPYGGGSTTATASEAGIEYGAGASKALENGVIVAGEFAVRHVDDYLINSMMISGSYRI